MNFTGERYIQGIEGWLNLQHYHRYYFVPNQIDLRAKIVLDIACGEGYGCDILSKYSKFVYGVDISEEVVDLAKKKYLSPNIEFLVGSVSGIPLDDSSVDVVTSFETIEHHNLHVEMILEIKRILKKDGILIISSPDKGYYEKYFPGYRNEFHIKELYYEELKSLISKHFKYVEFFLQNNTIGSIIASLNENLNFNKPIQIEQYKGKIMNIESRFNICIASNKKFQILNCISVCTPSFYYDFFSIIQNRDDTINQLRKNIEIIHNTNAWKIGRSLTFPFRKAKKIINQLKKNKSI